MKADTWISLIAYCRALAFLTPERRRRGLRLAADSHRQAPRTLFSDPTAQFSTRRSNRSPRHHVSLLSLCTLNDAIDVGATLGSQFIELGSNVFVSLAYLFGVEFRKLHYTHVGECLLDTRPPEPDCLDRWNNPREQPLLILLHYRGMPHVLNTGIGSQPEVIPHLFSEKTVPHQITSLNSE